jgi:hypothetical protein
MVTECFVLSAVELLEQRVLESHIANQDLNQEAKDIKYGQKRETYQESSNASLC